MVPIAQESPLRLLLFASELIARVPGVIDLSWRFSGEPCRIRTCDPLIKSQLLYQLS